MTYPQKLNPDPVKLLFKEEEGNFVKLSDYTIYRESERVKFIRVYDKDSQKFFDVEEPIFNNIFKKA